MVVPNEGGFALFSIPAIRERQDRSHSLYIRNMYLSYPKDSLAYTANFLGEKPVPVIAYSMNSVRFDYALSFFAVGDDIRFQYRLNKGSWSDFTTYVPKSIATCRKANIRLKSRRSFLTVQHHWIQLPFVYFHRGIAVLPHMFVILSWLCSPCGMFVVGMMSV